MKYLREGLKNIITVKEICLDLSFIVTYMNIKYCIVKIHELY
jgi:hypothetical protein